MNHPLFLMYGLAVLILTGYSEYRGLSLTKINELRNVPKTVRDNPGAYRSHYGFYPRYVGGK